MEKRPAWLLVVAQLIVAIAISGCGHKEEAAPESIPVTVQAAAVASGVVGGAYSANIVADTQVDVAFKVNGYVQSILQMKGADGKPRNVQAGDSVTTGTVLAVVKDDTYRNTLIKSQADLQNSRASLSKAQADFSRYTRLLEQKVVAKADYDAVKQQYESAQASVGAAQATVKQAQVDLDDCKLKSPMNGLVLNRTIEVGTLVSPNTVGFQLGDTSKVKVVFGVPGSIVGELKTGTELAVTTDAFPGQTFNAAITKVAAVADPNTHVFDIEATIPNPDSPPARRYDCRASFAGRNSGEEHAGRADARNSAAARRSQGLRGVCRRERRRRQAGRTLKKIEIGPVLGDQVSVESGLDAGAQVIVRGADVVYQRRQHQHSSVGAIHGASTRRRNNRDDS